jgi:hypothetical protein
MMIEAEMYGMMLSAKIAMRPKRAAGEHVEHAEDAPAAPLNSLRQPGIDARQRDVGAEAIDEQRAQREPDALLEVFALAKRPKFRFAASCSAADAMIVPRSRPRLLLLRLAWNEPAGHGAAGAP